ncbi:hypothetical protein BBJ28_00023748, partial [Nothophytophthora sp. Chile5]
MHYATTAKMMERSFSQQLYRRQALGLLKRQRFSFPVAPASAAHFASTTAAVHPPTIAETADHAEPVNVTNEPAYKAHFKQSPSRHPLGPTTAGGEPIWDNPINHAVYDLDKIATMEQTHHPITKFHERAAFLAVKTLRVGFDVISGYRGPGGAMTEKDWLNRCLFLESVAGVPGMVGGMLRHLRSLRLLKRDYGWIHTLLEEAENERMH